MKRLLSVFLVAGIVAGLSCAGAFPAGAADKNVAAAFADANFLAEVRKALGKPRGKITASDCAGVTSLKVPAKQIANLAGIEYFTELVELDCSGNRIKSLDLSKNTKLERLSCGANQLKKLDVSRNPALKTLSCERNSLTKLDVSRNPELGYLDCGSNQLRALDVSRNKKMVSLSCEGNPLETLRLAIGQEFSALKVDNENLYSEEEIHYAVERGDTLWALASRYLGDGRRWTEIQARNGGVDPRRLRVGMTLAIPVAAG